MDEWEGRGLKREQEAGGRPHHPALAPRGLFTKRPLGQGGKAIVVWVSSPRQMGTGYPAQYASVIIFQRPICGSRRSPGGPNLDSSSHPAFWWRSSLFCHVGVYYELSAPALWWDLEASLGHQGQDQDNRHGLDQGRDYPPSLL